MSINRECKLCQERGKTWKGDDPKCAFKKGIFDSDNWNCATMNAIRDFADELNTVVISPHDQRAALISFDDFSFLICGWYKNRGRTEVAARLFVTDLAPLTLEHAEWFLKKHGVKNE